MKVLFDTCTLIHLFKKESELHQLALHVFEACQRNRYHIYLSTLSVAEYCVKGNGEALFNRLFFRITPYDERAALTAAEYSKVTMADNALRSGENRRDVIKVDTQILAHAASSEMDYVVTADANTFAKTAERLARTGVFAPKVVMLDESALSNLELETPAVPEMPVIEQSSPTAAPIQSESSSEVQKAAPQQMSLGLFAEEAEDAKDVSRKKLPEAESADSSVEVGTENLDHA